MAYVYILESLRDGRYYIGSTKNLDKRLQHHKKGCTPSTKRFGEVKLVFKQEFPSLKAARYIERKLKNLKRKDYLKNIIRDKYIKIHNPA
jgi:putative endonuclease